MAFKSINQSFKCAKCLHINPAHQNSCRNHCRQCLFSMHLDENSPGDRLSDCRGLMEAKSTIQNGKKGWMIAHKCLKCGKEISNKSAPDDNFSTIITLTLKDK